MWDNNTTTISEADDVIGTMCGLYNFGINLSERAVFNSLDIYVDWYGKGGSLFSASAYVYLIDKRYHNDSEVTNGNTDHFSNPLYEGKVSCSGSSWSHYKKTYSFTESSLKQKLQSRYGTDNIKDFLSNLALVFHSGDSIGVAESYIKVNYTDYYQINAESNDSNYGEVSGTNIYKEKASVTLTAAPKKGYMFKQWADGNQDNPRTVVATEDKTYTAIFVPAAILTATCSPSDAGEIRNFKSGELYEAGTTLNLEFTINYGYDFYRWEDGSTINPRQITVPSKDTDYIANFIPKIYTISTNSGLGGIVEGGGDYRYKESAILTPKPNTGYHFVDWSDGSTENPRTVTVLENATYSARFAINIYEINSQSSPTEGGSIDGLGNYEHGDSVSLKPVPSYGYYFENWNDGNTENPRNFQATQNINYIANFKKIKYDINTNYDSTMGTIAIFGDRTFQSENNYLVVIPKVGHRFIKWEDEENTSSTRNFNLTRTLIESMLSNEFAFTPIFEKIDTTINSWEGVDDKGQSNDIKVLQEIIEKEVDKYVDNNIIKIGSYCFSDCSNLNFIYAPKATEIGEFSFNSCSKLITVRLSDELNKMDCSSFANCTNLTVLVLPNKKQVVNLSGDADKLFIGTNMLKEYGYVYVPEELITYYNDNDLYPKWKGIKFRKIEDYPDICEW